jgi:hypothetical protein
MSIFQAISSSCGMLRHLVLLVSLERSANTVESLSDDSTDSAMRHCLISVKHRSAGRCVLCVLVAGKVFVKRV